MPTFNLGKDAEDNDVYWFVKDNTSIIIEGIPGEGKSYLGMQLLAQMRDRFQLILDYEGEYYRNLRSLPLGRNFWWLPRIHQCSQPYFAFQEMSRHDLEGLHIPEGGALHLEKLTKINDRWKTIEDAIKALPTSRKGDIIKSFNMKYGVDFFDSVNEKSKQSLVAKLPILQEVFGIGGNYYDIPRLWKNGFKQVTLNFASDGISRAQMARTTLFFGMFMEQIWSHLYTYSPVVYVEEAILICPNVPEDKSFKSLDILNKFMLHQRRRTGSMLILVTQHETELSSIMQRTYKWKIRHEKTTFNGDRWWIIGDNNYWKRGHGISRRFKSHVLEYA